MTTTRSVSAPGESLLERVAAAPTAPQEIYAEQLRSCPVQHDPDGVMISRMADVLQINRHPDILGAGGATAPHGTMGAERPLIPLDLDGPVHLQYRRMLDPVFAPKRIAALEPAIRALTDSLIDGFVDRGHAEFFGEFCTPLPSNIFVNMMGVPAEHIPRFLAFKDDVIRPQGQTMEEVFEFAREAGRKTYAYFDELLDERDAAGEIREDLIGYLMAAEVDGHRLSRLELLDICYLLMIAGLDTVTSSFSCIIAWLAQHPAERAWILEDPARWPEAIEELMRYESPVFHGTRLATAEVEIGGNPYPAGTGFKISWAAANLDPEAFPDPLTVDLQRNPNKHIGFASGFHRCLGSHLARLELRVALEQLHRRIPDYRVAAGQDIVYSAVGVRLAGYLPLEWN